MNFHDLDQCIQELERHRSEAESIALAAFCTELASIKATHPQFARADLWQSSTPSLTLMETHEDSRLSASSTMSSRNSQLQAFLARFAPDSFAALCKAEIKMHGPDAESFARQMGRNDVAARLQARAIELVATESSASRPARSI